MSPAEAGDRVVMVVPPDLEVPTGGNRYDQALAGALGDLGAEVEIRPAPGRWPIGGAGDRQRLTGLLFAEDPVLVDGLVACGAPGSVAGAVAAGARVHVLVHLPLALETGLSAEAAGEVDALEGQALRAASGVIATSGWAAQDLRRRHNVAAVVARPGTEPATPATGSTPPRLLHLASLTPRKDQLGVLAALDLVRDRPWTACLTGPHDVDPAYTGRVHDAIARLDLADRVTVTGPLTGAALDAAWAGTDLLLLPSRAETWGMAVTEALARGIPVVVGAGSGAEEALRAGAGSSTDHGDGPTGRTGPRGLPGSAVPVGDPAALAAAIRDLLGPGRAAAVTAARAHSGRLPGWPGTALDVLAALR